MKTQGQLEAEISEAMTRFEKEYMGRGPTETVTYLVDDMVLVRLQGVLTPAEKQLVGGAGAARGILLVKQMRTELVEGARLLLEAVIHGITHCHVLSMHTDISTARGERLLIFILDGKPEYADPKSPPSS
ncbi:MAG TPA: DUF2294 domain-containing protein [Armatimonadota bacterium]|nr:DUF2294 domain-containing protein [Armatimonadota bacterium]HOS43307.1 DUF2294 domain-containing protein [Armatimonadota bacterium]